jgi:RNA polymerase sigma-70 factor (ECF subfamily)
MVALIRKIAEGDRSALTTLFDGTSRLLFGLVLQILGDRAAAEEVLLDIYTYVWKHAASYDSELFPPLEWLIINTRGRALARLHWNKQRRQKAEFPTRSLDSNAAVSLESQNHARSAIGSLSPAQREVLEWAFYSGLSCSEIAAQIGKPLGAVKIHARLGMNKLNELFRPLFERETQPETAKEKQEIEARKSD